MSNKNQLLGFVVRQLLLAGIMLLSMVGFGQNNSPSKVTGIVRTGTGQPLLGASVIATNKETGITSGTTSDSLGVFRFSALPSKGTYVFTFSMTGYETYVSGAYALKSGETTSVFVDLKPLASALNEVVVVGYGTQRKANLTGAVTTVNFEGSLANRPITNASQALGGVTPGLWISQNSGKPGNDGAQIRVRGWGTLNDANPLILIDGIEGSIKDVNPNDIQSITILKDAASSAIYGSRAANGVVLVTLKAGTFNKKVTLNLNSYYGMQSLGRRYDLVDNSAQYMQMWNQALVNQMGSPLFSTDLIDDFKKGGDPYKYPNTNFFDYVFEKSPITEHNLSLNGGSEKGKYYLSFNYLNQEGIIRSTGSQRYGITANLESKLRDWITIGGRFNGIKTTSYEPFGFDRVLYMFADGGYPFTAPYTRDGRFGSTQAIEKDGKVLVDQRNPLIETANGSNKTEQLYVKMNPYINIKFTDFLNWNINFVSQYTNALTDNHNQIVSGFTDDGREFFNLNFPVILEMSRSDLRTGFNSLFSTLNFNKTFNKHAITAVTGMQIESTNIKNLLGRKTTPSIPGLTEIDAGTDGIVANGTQSRLRMLSYFGRANYAFDNKYLFETNLRADASSRFKEDSRWGIFPSFSAGWRLDREKFIKKLDLFSMLKIRASWGKLGNQNIGSYWPYLTVINQNNDLSYASGNTLLPGAAVTDLADSRVTWETATNFDLGVEVGVLENRLTMEADYFNKVTSDIIVQLPIPQLFGGLTPPFQNIGKMNNKGFEINVTYTNRKSGRNNFSYLISPNLTYVTNEVTKFQGGKSPDQLYLIREGYSYKTLYGFKSIGIFQTDQEGLQYMQANGYKPKAGELKYEDVNGDGKLDFMDKMSLGNTIPRFTFGLNSNFYYKGFDLSLLMQGAAKFYVATQNPWTIPFSTSGGTITRRWENAWTPQHTNTDLPMLKLANQWNTQQSSFWMQELSYLKIKNIQLGYQLAQGLTNRLGLQRIYIYTNAQNYITFVSKKYEGFDPERNTFDSGSNYYPIARILTFGINVTL